MGNKPVVRSICNQCWKLLDAALVCENCGVQHRLPKSDVQDFTIRAIRFALIEAGQHRPVYDDCCDIQECTYCDWVCPEYFDDRGPNDVSHWEAHLISLAGTVMGEYLKEVGQ